MTRLSPIQRMSYDDLVNRASSLIRPDSRALLGIVGSPGSGKSTLAQALAKSLNSQAQVVPMDGYHLANDVLEARGYSDRKGAIHTFDSWGFLSLIERLKVANHTVYAPEYRREIEEPIAGAIPIDPSVPLLIIEGNYLLCDGPAWHKVRTYLTESWFISIDEDVRLSRLIDRHMRFGRSAAAAQKHALGSDQKNARLIEESAQRADLIVDIKNW